MSNGRCVIYTRISDDREGEGLGVERQEADCRKLAAQLGCEVVHVYSDNDVGASTKTSKKKVRSAYLEMLKDARKGQFSRILAYSNSRITRRPLELEALIELYDETGVVINTVVSGNDDLSAADGRMVARIKASVDAAEAERISERVKAAVRQKAMKGEPGLQRRRPFGFMKDAVTHHPEESALIRAAVEKVIAGASITSIKREWERAGVKTTDGNETWGWQPIKRVLLGWRTAGVREYKGEPLYTDAGELVLAKWKPIITLEEREKAIAMLEKRTRKGERQGKWLLQGLLKCGICGHNIYGALLEPKQKNRYSCSTGGTSHLSISAQRLEHHIERVNQRYLLDKAIANQGVARSQRDEAAWPHEERLKTVSEKIVELMDAYNSNILSGSIVFPQVENLEGERKQLRREREVFYAEQIEPEQNILTLDDAFRYFSKIVEFTFEERQTALKQEIMSVVIKPGVKGRAGGQEANFRKRIEFNWREPHSEYNGVRAEDAIDTIMTFPRSVDD